MTETASWPRRVWRNLYWWREDRRIRAHFRGVRQVVYFGGDGIGDELLCSAPLHELRRRGETGVCLMTRRPEFFSHSPDVADVRPMDYTALRFLQRAGVRTSPTGYIHAQLPPDIDVPPPRHLIAEMCRLCGIRGEIELRPYLTLTTEELAAAERFAGCLVVQSSRRSASLTIGNKEWIPERFQAVVDALAQRGRIVQIGQKDDPLLRGAEDLRGKTSLRESAAVLQQARGFIGLVGFLMHLARAVDCPAVIVYGGREAPNQSGYTCNENLYNQVPCAPCWRWNSCVFEHRCMTGIQANDVVAAVDRLLARPRGPLAVERVTLD
jgi:ADP-heptose:LPS heptosyltransferase